MITGFNTDVEFGGVTYHIQTEDKGLDTPIILSLVYDRGTILAAKRAPYDDLIEKGFDEKALGERLTKQHKTICAAVRKGRIEELKGLSQKSNGRAPAVKGIQTNIAVPDILDAVEVSVSDDLATVLAEPEQDARPDVFDEVAAAPIPMPAAPIGIPKNNARGESLPLIENVTVVDLPEPLPFDAVRVISDLAGKERTESNKLSLQFIGDDTFHGGRKSYVTVMVCRGGRMVVEGAEVMVKLLGSSFRPLIFHAQTDKNGISTVGLEIPSFNTGRASLLVRAISKGEEVEMRRPIIHG